MMITCIPLLLPLNQENFQCNEIFYVSSLATSSASSKEKEASPKAKPRPKPSEKEKPKAEDKVEEKKEATEKVEIKEEDKEKEEEQQQQQEDKKPVPQKRPIPGARPGVPLPGAIGFGGDLLAEMKKRQSSTKAKKVMSNATFCKDASIAYLVLCLK